MFDFFKKKKVKTEEILEEQSNQSAINDDTEFVRLPSWNVYTVFVKSAIDGGVGTVIPNN